MVEYTTKLIWWFITFYIYGESWNSNCIFGVSKFSVYFSSTVTRIEWHEDGNHLSKVLLKSVSYIFRGFMMEWSETLRDKIGKKKTFVFWENRLFWLSNLKQKERRCYWQKDLKKHDPKWLSSIDGTVSSVSVRVWMEDSLVRTSAFFWSLSFPAWPKKRTVDHMF